MCKNKGLNYVPVFGYLSLRYKNFHELGKRSQDEVHEEKTGSRPRWTITPWIS